MSKLRKDKIALFLACMSVLSGKTQAMNIGKAKSSQTVATVRGGATLKNNRNILGAVDKSKNTTDLPNRKIENKSFINKAFDWIKAKPGKAAAIGAGVITAATAAVALPILLCKSKNSKPPQAMKDKENNPKKDLKKNEIENQKEVQGENKGNPEGNLGENLEEEKEEVKEEEKKEVKEEEKKEVKVEEKKEVKVEEKKEVKVEEKKEVKKEKIEIINIVNPAVNTNYQKFDWRKVKFSSNDGYAAKTATMIDNNKYLQSLKETYDIKENFTAGKVNNVYDGAWYKASLIVIDCNCNEFCKKGALKDKNGNPSAYCNGRGQIFILSSENISMNYGTKGTEGKWTLEEKDNEYCVYWHTS